MNKEEFDEIKNLLNEYPKKNEIEKSVMDVIKGDTFADGIITHLKECSDPECNITKFKNELEEDGIALGLLLGDAI